MELKKILICKRLNKNANKKEREKNSIRKKYI